MPAIAPMSREALDPHSRRLYDHIGVAEAALTDDDVRNARHAYYGAVSYIDDQLGHLLDALHRTELAENTIVVFLSDHGEALGERGLWFKRSFFDCALQVPLIMSSPALLPSTRCHENVSLIDLFPTVVDLATSNGGVSAIQTRHDGRSLRSLWEHDTTEKQNFVFAELTGEGVEAPAVMVMEDRYKYIHCEGDPPQLYDRSSDKLETRNLAGQDDVAAVESRLAAAVAANWDLDDLRRLVLESQCRRRIVDRAHSLGQSPSWDYEPVAPGGGQYFRPCPANPSASNYNSRFEVRLRPDSEIPNRRDHP